MTHDDEWSAHVSNGEAFVAEGFQAAVGGQLGFAQLFNPVGSGIRLRLRCLETMPILAISINSNVRRHDVPLGVLGAFAGPENLLGGGAAAVAEIRTLSQVAMIGSLFWLILSAGSTRKDYPTKHLDWGHDLLPGQGIMLNSAVGGFILVGFMWAEVPL